jgi:hypothetical protein
VAYAKRFRASIQKAIDMKTAFMGSGSVITGVRSVAPAGLHAVSDTHRLFKHFWKHGSTDTDPERLSQSGFLNPTFAVQVTDNFTQKCTFSSPTPLSSYSPLPPTGLAL